MHTQACARQHIEAQIDAFMQRMLERLANATAVRVVDIPECHIQVSFGLVKAGGRPRTHPPMALTARSRVSRQAASHKSAPPIRDGD